MIFYSFKLGYNKINAACLTEWLEDVIATDGKFLVLVLPAVGDVVPPLTVGDLTDFEQRCDGDSVDEHPVLRDRFLKSKVRK